MNINLHIERLVLDGVGIAPEAGGQVQTALAAELGRLLAAGWTSSAWKQGTSLRKLDGLPVQMDVAAGPAEFGRQVARSIHGGCAK